VISGDIWFLEHDLVIGSTADREVAVEWEAADLREAPSALLGVQGKEANLAFTETQGGPVTQYSATFVNAGRIDEGAIVRTVIVQSRNTVAKRDSGVGV
jgi:hypothetical protein